MDVVGHDNVSTNQPSWLLSPHISQHGMDGIICEKRLPIFRANGQEDDRRGVETVTDRGVRRMFATIGFHGFGLTINLRKDNMFYLEGWPPCRPKY